MRSEDMLQEFGNKWGIYLPIDRADEFADDLLAYVKQEIVEYMERVQEEVDRRLKGSPAQ